MEENNETNINEAVEDKNGNIGFKRFFSDFIVVEKHGEDLCGSWPVEKLKPFVVAEETKRTRPSYVTDADYLAIQKICDSKEGSYSLVLQDEYNNKENRKEFHLYLRDEFDNKLISVSRENAIDITPVKNKGKHERRSQWPSNVGKHLHFTMKKTDHEVSHALNCIARCLNLVNAKPFEFAGVKDRRAVTYQRVSAFKFRDYKFQNIRERLAQQGIEVSEFSYEIAPIRMSCHTANVFYIILRNADIDETRFNEVQQFGCFNIYGPQRFGSVSGNTAHIGLLILKDDYEGVVKALLDPNACAHGLLKECLKNYAEIQDASVLKEIPPFMKKFNEVLIINALSKFKNDSDKYLKAILQLPRNVRSLYVHAYQSKLFNSFIEEFQKKHSLATCSDIQVPLPSHETLPEDAEVYQIYTELLARDGLKFEDFKKHAVNFAVHNTYRRLLLKPSNMSFKRIQHSDPNVKFEFYPTPTQDVDYGQGHQSILLHFELPPGSYATTVLTAIYGKDFKTGGEEIEE